MAKKEYYRQTANAKPSAGISFEEEVLKAVDEYRFSKRKESRSEAVNELIEMGLKYLELKRQRALRKKQEQAAAVG